MKPKVIITVPNLGQKIDTDINNLKNNGFDVDWDPLNSTNETEKIIKTVKGYNFVIAGGELWDSTAIEGVKETMKMIVRFGVGYDKVDLDTASRYGIAVSNTPNRCSKAVAEHALALMLDLTRGITKYDKKLRSGRWEPVLSGELFGKTVGLVGFGSIARELTKLLKPFSNKIIAYDNCKDENTARDLGVEYMELDDLLSRSDYVSLHIPLNIKTEGIVNEKFLSKMKKTAFFINTSRGKLVDEDALIRALQKGEIAGAGLDVYQIQPLLPVSNLTKIDSVVLTPHVASTNEGGFKGMMEGSVKNILDFNSGKELKSILNPEYKNFLK